MQHERIAKFEPPLIDQRHLANTTARRIRFAPPETVRGTLIRAQRAMHAARVVFICGLINRSKTAERQSEFALRFFVSLRCGRGHDSRCLL